MDKLQFYIKSANKPAGKGVGKHVEKFKDYNELNKIENWRRMFSSLWSGEYFEYNNHHYKSYEHAFQSEKIRCNRYNDIAFNFTIESNTELGNGIGLDAFKARKILQLSEQEINNWHANVNSTKDELYKAKFMNGKAKDALILTGNA